MSDQSTSGIPGPPLQPGAPDPLTTLRQEIAALRRQIDLPLGLDDLPLRALKLHLQALWQPDAAELLLPGSITANLLASDANVAPHTAGSGTYTTEGTGRGTATITHGLNAVPTFIGLTIRTAEGVSYYMTAKSATTAAFSFVNGFAVTTYTFDWAAFR